MAHFLKIYIHKIWIWFDVPKTHANLRFLYNNLTQFIILFVSIFPVFFNCVDIMQRIYVRAKLIASFSIFILIKIQNS